LALEKISKGFICRRTHNVPPWIHNLTRLSELARLKLDDRQADVLADMNEFNLEGRYPEFSTPQPSPQEAMEYVMRSEEILTWLIQQL
jgi:HEPN domain-containing protein